METWKLENEAPAYNGWIKVVRRTYTLPDGHSSDWDVMAGTRTVAIVARTTDNRFILARQFRPGPAVVLDELPGGYVDEGEEVVEAARRELLEETGYQPEQATLIGTSWLAANAAVRRHVVFADGCQSVALPTPGPDEATEVVLMSQEDFVSHVRDGDLTDQDCAYRVLDFLGLL